MSGCIHVGAIVVHSVFAQECGTIYLSSNHMCVYDVFYASVYAYASPS